MISRSEFEALILEKLIEIRRAESTLTRRFKRLTHSNKGRTELLYSLTDLDLRAKRLEVMLNALTLGELSGEHGPVAA